MMLKLLAPNFFNKHCCIGKASLCVFVLYHFTGTKVFLTRFENQLFAVNMEEGDSFRWSRLNKEKEVRRRIDATVHMLLSKLSIIFSRNKPPGDSSTSRELDEHQ
ncbi:hypothetical protein ACFE04_020299 [Oxalis oulophora]